MREEQGRDAKGGCARPALQQPPPPLPPAGLVWLQELGGVYVMACLRGGGEYGEEWHQAGAKFNKQNVFDDFAAVAQHLTETGVAVPSSLGIMGGSNGGLLALACALQRPQLYGASVAQVGRVGNRASERASASLAHALCVLLAQVPVADMLRYHKWTVREGTRGAPEGMGAAVSVALRRCPPVSLQVGALWAGEYLNCETDPAALDFLLTYSPREGPATSPDPALPGRAAPRE